jgi:hypothetical protein
VFELHRVVVPSCSGAAAVRRIQASSAPYIAQPPALDARLPSRRLIPGYSISRLCRNCRKLISVLNIRYCWDFRHGHFAIGSVGATAPKLSHSVIKSPRQLKLVARHADLLAPAKGPGRGPLKAETRVRIP